MRFKRRRDFENEGYKFLFLPKHLEKVWVWLETVKWRDLNAMHKEGYHECSTIVFFDKNEKLL